KRGTGRLCDMPPVTMYDSALKGLAEKVVRSKLSFKRCSHSAFCKKISQGSAMLADASGPCTSPSSGSEIRRSTASECRYLNIGVDSTEKKGSVATTLPPCLSLLAAQFRNAIGLFR